MQVLRHLRDGFVVELLVFADEIDVLVVCDRVLVDLESPAQEALFRSAVFVHGLECVLQFDCPLRPRKGRRKLPLDGGNELLTNLVGSAEQAVGRLGHVLAILRKVWARPCQVVEQVLLGLLGRILALAEQTHLADGVVQRLLVLAIRPDPAGLGRVDAGDGVHHLFVDAGVCAPGRSQILCANPANVLGPRQFLCRAAQDVKARADAARSGRASLGASEGPDPRTEAHESRVKCRAGDTSFRSSAELVLDAAQRFLAPGQPGVRFGLQRAAKIEGV